MWNPNESRSEKGDTARSSGDVRAGLHDVRHFPGPGDPRKTPRDRPLVRRGERTLATWSITVEGQTLSKRSGTSSIEFWRVNRSNARSH